MILNDNIDFNKTKRMLNVKINDWFVMNENNVDIEWRCLNMIKLHDDDDIYKPTMDLDNIDMNIDNMDRPCKSEMKLKHKVKINDWFEMDNKNDDTEWKHLNMTKLCDKGDCHKQKPIIDMDIIDMNKDNMEQPCNNVMKLNDNLGSQHHHDASKELNVVFGSHLSDSLNMNNDKHIRT